ncbi:MAG: DNA repair protein RadC [Pseudomonadota bacterium]
MAIANWPSQERPREKLLQHGAQSLSDAELLAIFIRTGTHGKTSLDIARGLLAQFGGVRHVLCADNECLLEVPGLGESKIAQLRAAAELGVRCSREKLLRSGPLSSPKQAGEFLTQRLRDQTREVFAVVYLDTRHQVLEYEELFFGTINGASVHPREVVKNCLRKNAAALIVAHNHPSGIAEPSNSDALLTRRLKDALDTVDIKLLDHLVIGDGEYISMSERGLF